MKSISNRRKFKLFLKDIQRNEKEGYDKIVSFFADKGVLLNQYSVYTIFNKLTPDQFKRFMKLCTRLGGAAKKRNLFVKAMDVYYCVLGVPSFSDPRKITFYKCEIVKEIFERTHYIYSPENPENYSPLFRVYIFTSKDQKIFSENEPSTLKEILQKIKSDSISKFTSTKA
jgi:hypothetical protein